MPPPIKTPPQGSGIPDNAKLVANAMELQKAVEGQPSPVETEVPPSDIPEAGPDEADLGAQRKRSASEGKGPDAARDSKKSDYRPSLRETRGSELPRELGHKINVNPHVARENSGLPQPRPQMTGLGGAPELPPGMRHAQARPLPPQPTQAQYRAVSQDKVFQGVLHGSPLHQKMQAKALEQNRHMQRTGERHASEEILKKGELGQLFRARHKFEQRDDANKVLRYEAAKARQEARQKVQALKYQNESTGGKEEMQALERTQETRGDALREQLAHRLSVSSSESVFEQLLQRVLAGDESVPELPESVRARFASKTEAEWEAFFKNALSLNSTEIESEGQLNKLVEALFRGLYQRGADGKMMLVSDLTFTGRSDAEIDPAEFKFSRIALNDKELLALLEKLKPGDVISRELMQKLGDAFLFIQLAHMVDQTTLSNEQKMALLKEYRQQMSSASQKGLEDALIGRRNKNKKPEKDPAPFGYAGDQFNKKERYIGPPKFLLYMVYGVIAVTVMIVLFIIFRAAF